MLPSDDSVIWTTKIQIGSWSIGRSVVLKDNLLFGIKEQNNKEHFGDEILDDSYKDSLPNPSNFWLKFGEDCRLFVEMKLEGSF